jgi:hypothetical protein
LRRNAKNASWTSLVNINNILLLKYTLVGYCRPT